MAARPRRGAGRAMGRAVPGRAGGREGAGGKRRRRVRRGERAVVWEVLVCTERSGRRGNTTKADRKAVVSR